MYVFIYLLTHLFSAPIKVIAPGNITAGERHNQLF